MLGDEKPSSAHKKGKKWPEVPWNFVSSADFHTVMERYVWWRQTFVIFVKFDKNKKKHMCDYSQTINLYTVQS